MHPNKIVDELFRDHEAHKGVWAAFGLSSYIGPGWAIRNDRLLTLEEKEYTLRLGLLAHNWVCRWVLDHKEHWNDWEERREGFRYFDVLGLAEKERGITVEKVAREACLL